MLKVVQKRSRVSPAGRVHTQNFCYIYFWSENDEIWCILGGILCDLELQDSKQETRYRPGKSKGAGSPTLATRPHHFKPCTKHPANDVTLSNYSPPTCWPLSPPSHIHRFIPGSIFFHHSLLAPTWTAFLDYTGAELICWTVFHF